MIFVVPDFPFAVLTVMVTLPSLTGVTRPFASTVAIRLSELDQVKVVDAPAGLISAVSCSVSPMLSFRFCCTMETDFGGSATPSA